MNQVNKGSAESATLRRATAEDASAVTDVLVRSRRAAAGAIPASIHSDDEFLGWVRAIVIPEREVWLARRSRRTVPTRRR